MAIIEILVGIWTVRSTDFGHLWSLVTLVWPSLDTELPVDSADFAVVVPCLFGGKEWELPSVAVSPGVNAVRIACLFGGKQCERGAAMGPGDFGVVIPCVFAGKVWEFSWAAVSSRKF